MKSSRRAVIDIGTNSVKLLIGDVVGQQVVPVHEQSEQTRLGSGFYETHILQKKAIAETAEAVAKFAAEARKSGAQSLRVIATSAARDAKNPGDLLDAIRKIASLDVQIISGAQEADWAFQGVTSNPQFSQRPLLILDVGGGSTEFIVGQHGQTQFRESFNVGTVRLMEQLQASDPPMANELDDCRAWLFHFLQERVAPSLKPVLQSFPKSHLQLVGTGGTSTILGKIERQMEGYDREGIESVELTRARVHELTGQLWGVSLAERRTVPGLPAKRADVILFGVLVYEAVMTEFDFSTLRVSTRGLRYAALVHE